MENFKKNFFEKITPNLLERRGDPIQSVTTLCWDLCDGMNTTELYVNDQMTMFKTQWKELQRHTKACKLFYNNDLHPLGSVRTPYRGLQTLQYNDKMLFQKLPLSTYY